MFEAVGPHPGLSQREKEFDSKSVSGLDFSGRDLVFEVIGCVGVKAPGCVFGDRVHEEIHFPAA